ncbi:MAG: S1/P1 nuclease [Holophaga sp.]|nr:S1/P1 nuclease [Holophaga sp.]
MRLLPCLLVLSLCAPLAAWGRKGHEIVASLACRDLPPDLAPWFRGREDTLRDHCNDPDEWRQGDPREGPRHFLDCEAYGGPGAVPRELQAARDRLGPEAFQRNGQVPWVIQDRVQELAEAFRAGDPDRVAWTTAILSHYVGDLNVPLHTTVNYDGKLSGQAGVHSRWETGLVHRLGSWDPEPRTARLDGRDMLAPWDWLVETNALVAPLLQDDLDAVGSGRREAHGEAAGSAYWAEFGRRQGPVVKAQLERAGQRTARMILLAWHLAGEPAPRET